MIHDVSPGTLDYAKKMSRACEGANHGQIIDAMLVMIDFLLSINDEYGRRMICMRIGSVMEATAAEYLQPDNSKKY